MYIARPRVSRSKTRASTVQHSHSVALLRPCRLAGGMELSLTGPGIKLFGKAIHSLCKVGACV